MAQWKRAGPITQRSVDRNYLLLIFSKKFGEKRNRNSYLTNQRERIRRDLHYIASEEPQYQVDSFHKSRGQQDGAVEVRWAHNPEVGRSELPPANFFQGFE